MNPAPHQNRTGKPGSPPRRADRLFDSGQPVYDFGQSILHEYPSSAPKVPFFDLAPHLFDWY